MELEIEPIKSLYFIKETSFELAYLVLLTLLGIKPISRWERPLETSIVEKIYELGLEIETARRKTETGKVIIEFIFSLFYDNLNLYKKNFDGKLIDKSPKTQRLEGILFGYPSCCVENFIENPYSPNNFPKEDQKILFHWACPDCEKTKNLLPKYREIHNFLKSLTNRR